MHLVNPNVHELRLQRMAVILVRFVHRRFGCALGLFGRAVVAKAKPVPAPVPPVAPAPSAEIPVPSVPMMTLDGHP